MASNPIFTPDGAALLGALSSMIMISFVVFLSLFAFIGLISVKFSQGTQKDYYLASHSVPPWLVGLSAVATNNSGYMFIGVIGYTYATGLASIWLMVGWILGDLLGSFFIHRKLRDVSKREGVKGYISALSLWQGTPMAQFQRLAAIIAFVFLLAYASAQLVAGSKALVALLSWPAYAGAILGAAIVLGYCWAGGIRASIWTDAAQSIVMVLAMGLLLVAAVDEFGGVAGAYQALDEIPMYMNWFPQDLAVPGLLGGLLFVLGWLFAGFSVVGQPHIMVRFMALESSHKMNRARMWYYAWFTAFYCMATAVGLLSRIALPETASFDAELALPTMATQLLHPALVGLILAGIFAATISTADSLVLACSSILSTDLLQRSKSSLTAAKLATVFVVLGALGWALLSKQSVFNMVVMSWSTLGSAFAPLLILLVLKLQISEKQAIGVMLVAIFVSLTWRWQGLHSAVYEGLPAIIVALLSYPVFRLLTRSDPAEASSRT